MKTVGFPISHKENERRRAIVPDDIKNIPNPEMLYFEQGYGDELGICDKAYSSLGCHCVSREEVLKQVFPPLLKIPHIQWRELLITS